MKRANATSLQEQLAKVRLLMSKAHLPLAQMSEEQIIRVLRKTREELWEAKVAPRPR